MLKKIMMFILVALTLNFTACSCNEDKVNDTRKDLKEFYGYSEISGKDTYIVVCDGNKLGMGFKEDGKVYVPYTEYRKNIDNKCYIDKNENMFIYTTANNIYDSYVGGSEYTDINGNSSVYDVQPSLEVNGEYYVCLDFVKEMGKKIEYKLVEDPNRIVVTSIFENKVASATKDTELRIDASDRTDILTSVKEGDKLIFVEEKEDYTLVTDSDGVTGYILTSAVGDFEANVIDREEKPDEYSHIVMDEKVCLGWHQMEYASGNDKLGELIKNAEPLNVISPTWYKLLDENGNIESLSDANYVKKAHDKGIEVWALISDFVYNDNDEFMITNVISHTTSRRNLIKNLMEDVKENDIDGINVDFECIGIAVADDYVEFICELSVFCRKENIVLSVDMYVPTSFNEYYNRETVLEVADYLMVMGYDEHWSGGDSAGSVASLPYVEKGIVDTIASGDSNRVVNAIPFYTRIWSETPVEFAEDGSHIVEDNVKGSYALDSRAVGLGTAEKELDKLGINKFWVEDLSQYYAEYEDGNSLVRVWLEEEKSIGAKLDVMKKHNVGGVACWRLGLEEDWVWDLISKYVNE